MKLEKFIAGPSLSENRAQDIVSLIIRNLETNGFYPEFFGEAAQAHKEKLERIAKRLPTIGRYVLETFRELAHEQGVNPGKLTLYVVGGRVRGTPIKDNTDFDLVIAAEHELTPFAKTPTITLAQRHAMGRALYTRVEQLFSEMGMHEDYERGILEFKGFGERTSKTVENEHDVLKLVEDPG